eukprot:363740-Chlamydomonas_euryale.AAC.29
MLAPLEGCCVSSAATPAACRRASVALHSKRKLTSTLRWEEGRAAECSGRSGMLGLPANHPEVIQSPRNSQRSGKHML